MQQKDPIDPRARVRLAGEGFAAEGRDFFIWDFDEAEVARVAQEIEKGNYGVATQCRVIVQLRRQRSASASPESLDV